MNGSNPSAYALLGVLNLRKVQTKDTSISALKMKKSGPRTAAKPLGGPSFKENAKFQLKKHEIAAFVLVDKSGYFYGGGCRIRTRVDFRPNGFQDRPVMTASVTLRVC